MANVEHRCCCNVALLVPVLLLLPLHLQLLLLLLLLLLLRQVLFGGSVCTRF
jgi:hypothetical protein